MIKQERDRSRTAERKRPSRSQMSVESTQAPKSHKLFNTLDALRAASEAGAQQHRKQLDATVAQIVNIADAVENDPVLWRAFVCQPVWCGRRQRPRHQTETLRFAFLWAFGDRKRASLLYRAVRPLYADPGLDGSSIVRHIHERGGGYTAAASTAAQVGGSGERRATDSKLGQLKLTLACSGETECLETAEAEAVINLVVKITSRTGRSLIAEVCAAKAEEF